MKTSGIHKIGSFVLIVCLCCSGSRAFSQHQPASDAVIQDQANFRFVHHGILANLIPGRYVMTATRFSFFPSRPVWLLDSIHLDVARIDTVTVGIRSLLIRIKGEQTKPLQIQCRHPKEVLAAWMKIQQGRNRPLVSPTPHASAQHGYEVHLSGSTFGSTIHTPIGFPAFLVLDARGFTLQPMEAPLSLLHASYARKDIKRIRLNRGRIRVILHNGGRFNICTLGNETVKDELCEWYAPR